MAAALTTRVSDQTELVRKQIGRGEMSTEKGAAAAVFKLVLKCTRTIAPGESGAASFHTNLMKRELIGI